MQNLKRETLANGLVLITEELEHFKSTSISFYLKRGSRDETSNEKGYSHFCEHMLFKGTDKYSKEDIANIFDLMGGNFNALQVVNGLVSIRLSPIFIQKKQ